MAAGRGPGGEEEGYLASVSDLMVGMLFVFIIMLMAFALNFRSAEERVAEGRDELEAERRTAARERDRLAAERDAVAAQRDELLRGREALDEVSARLADLEARRAALLRDVAADLGRRDVPAALDAANGVLRLPESLLFDSGEASLRPEGERALSAVAEALARALPCHSVAPADLRARCDAPARPLLEAVLVEGHTDDVPLRGGGPFGDNWALSAARGVSTFKALTRAAPALEALRNGRGEALLGVAGYEARRPAAEGDGPEARRRNRRIDLRFLVAAPSDAELGELVRRLGPAGRGG
jgi:chemotaxis protein MotB